MKKYLKYLKIDLKPALTHLPSPETFEVLYGDGFKEDDLSGVPVKTLAAWLGIDLETLPPADRLTEDQQIHMSKTLLSYWRADDELANVIRHTLPKRQYEGAIEYLSIKAQYNGLGGFHITEPPLTPEEFEELRQTHDKMMNDMFGNRNISNASTDNQDEDLPF